MPPAPFPDGPACTDPKAVAALWDSCEVVKERANRLQKLVQGKDPKETLIKNNRETMVHNACILEALARDMAARGRCGADPVDVIYEMVDAWYTKYPLYPQFAEKYDAKGWAHNAAWAIHKMISRIRNVVPKHSSIRVLWLNLSIKNLFFHLSQNAMIFSKKLYTDFIV